MTLENPVWLQAAAGDATITYSGREVRTWIDAIFATEGVVGLTDLKVTQRGAGADMSVDVAAGLVVITGDSIAAQGKYVARNTAVYNVALANAPTSGTRTDFIVAELYDKQAAGGTQYGWNIVARSAVPATAVLLAQVTVGTNVASIVNSVITDKRAIARTAPGPNPAIQLGFAGSLTVANGGSWVNLTGWSAAGTGGGAWQGGMTSAAPSGVTVPRSGPYWLGGNAVFDAASTGGRRGVSYTVNGALLSTIAQSVISGDAAGTNVPGVPFLEQLSAGDVVNLAVYQTAGGTLHVTSASLSVAFAG